MALICIARHDARHFTGWPESPSSEISTLQTDGLRFMAPLYDDACDVGFILVNPETRGETAWFWVEDIVHGAGDDAEIAGWKFRATPETARRYPALANTVLSVWND